MALSLSKFDRFMKAQARVCASIASSVVLNTRLLVQAEGDLWGALSLLVLAGALRTAILLLR